jgi:hypothetical protein
MQINSSIFAPLLMMTKKKIFRTKGIGILLIYLASLFPFSIFHHHEKQVDYAHATHCQKYIYYGKEKDKCSHQTHLSKKTSKCSLCDDHIVVPHLGTVYTFNFFSAYAECRYHVCCDKAVAVQYSRNADRGPPAV